MAESTTSFGFPSSERAVPPANQATESEHIIFEAMEWGAVLGSLTTLVEQPQGVRKSCCRNTFNMPKWCFHDTFGTSASPKPAADAKFQMIMAWLYVLTDEYVDMLKENRAGASGTFRSVASILESSPQVQWIQLPLMQVERGIRFMQEVVYARKMKGCWLMSFKCP